MRTPMQAIAWEIWAANRRSWLVVFAVLGVFTVIFAVLPEEFCKSTSLNDISIFPAALMLCFVMAIFNFTEANPRKGFAGFPQRLFAMPVRTCWLVGCPMLCGVLSVVGLYAAWTMLVFRPAGFDIMVRWPATLLAAAVVFYQAIIWCLSGFRVTRLVVLGIVLSYLVAVGFVPHLPSSLRGTWTEGKLTLVLVALMIGAYGIAVFAVDRQRHGGGQAWAWRATFLQRLADAVPHRHWNLSSPDRALLWMEWRRNGMILPVAVLLTLLMIMGPVSWFAGTGPKATGMAVWWIAISPILLALPVGQGISKPDFWTLELALSPFVSARPISSGQIVGAKMKSAALGTVLAWLLVLTATPLWLYLKCDTENLRGVGAMFRSLYAPQSRGAISALAIVAAMLLSWSLLVGGIWRGYSGRPWFFYSLVGLSIALFIAWLVLFAWWVDPDEDHGSPFVGMLPWLPWVLSAFIIAKCWLALGVLHAAWRRGTVSKNAIVAYLGCWAAGTGCFALLACLLFPAVDWLRSLMLLGALLAMPLARVFAAPLAVAWNRHR